jgi:hypothetical protein
MQRRTRDIILALLAIALIALLITHQSLTQQAQQARDTLLATLKTPPQVQYYQDLATTASTPNDPNTSPKPTAAPAPNNPCGTPHDIIARWATLFEEAEVWYEHWSESYLFNAASMVFEPELYAEFTPEEYQVPLETLYEEAEAISDFLDRVRTFASCGGPLHLLDFPESYEQEPPHWYGGVNEIQRILSADARIAARQNDPVRITNNLLSGMRIADALAREPLIGAQVYRHSHYLYFPYIYNQVNEHVLFSNEHLTQLSDHLAQAHHREGIYNALPSEAHRTRSHYESWGDRTFLDSVSGRGIYWGTRNWLWASPICEPLFLEDERTALELLESINGISNAPLFEIESQLDEIQAYIDTLPITRNAAKQGIPAIIESSFIAQASHERRIDLWRLRLLIDQYRAETNTLPDTLQAAATHFNDPLPLDPFDGEPYFYEREEDCYILTRSLVTASDETLNLLKEESRTCPKEISADD